MKTENSPDSRPNDGYKEFAQSIQENFNARTKNKEPLFILKVNNLFNTFLNYLPEEGRQYYNCNCCKAFVNKFGSLCTIKDGKVIPLLWAKDVPQFFKESVSEIIDILEKTMINRMLFSSDKILGKPVTGEWEHMSLVLPDHYVFQNPLLTGNQKSAEVKEEYRMLSRSLGKFSIETIQKAQELLKSGILNRSEQFISFTQTLLNLKDSTQNAGSTKKSVLIWEAIANAPTGFAHIGGSVISTLLSDIDKGLDSGSIKRRFDEKTNTSNYQRSQTPPSSGNIKRGEDIVKKLGIEDSLERRYATLDEIEKIWTPSTIEKEKSNGVFGGIKPRDSKMADIDFNLPESTMTWVKFSETVLPNVLSIKALVSNSSRLCAIVAAKHADSKNILKWNNQYSWYYHGGVDAEIRSRLDKAGAGYEDMDIRCSLIWNNTDDLDIHCITPSGEHIYYPEDSKRSMCGGWLDIDMNANSLVIDPVENIRWETAPSGHYKFYVHNYADRNHGSTPYKVELAINGEVFTIEDEIIGTGSRKDAFEFDYIKGQTPIGLSSSSQSISDWNVQENSFVEVKAICNSPNVWDSQRGSLAHKMFMLDGCKDISEGKGRGFFVEMLKPELREIRKTLEAYSANSTIEVCEGDSACGLGYSDSSEWDLVLKVKTKLSTRLIKIDRVD